MSATEFTAEPFLDIRCEVGEAPCWDYSQQRLIWVDITGRRVHEYHTDGTTRTHTVPQDVGAAVPTEDGLALALRDGIALLAPRLGVLRWLSPIEADRPDLRFNDAKCDPQGRLWAGTMPYRDQPGQGALYRIDRSGVTRVLSGLRLSNGLAWSPDGLTMYHIDSGTQTVTGYDFDPANGGLSNRRTVVRVPTAAGMPDGMTVDEQGYLWVAAWNGAAIYRYSPDGVVDGRIDVPTAQVTACTFGGPDGRTLFITTANYQRTAAEQAADPDAGRLFAVPLGIGAPPATPFTAPPIPLDGAGLVLGDPLRP